MGTYWYMGCDKCKKKTEDIIAVTRIAGNHLDHKDSLLNFLLEHPSYKGCELKFFSEYDEDRNFFEDIAYKK